MEATTEIQELSLEKVIETKLVQANVTHQVLEALKEKYGGMTLKALDDKESYLELKVAARDCAKVRTLTVKLCKEGRERAIKEQKLWVAKQNEIVAEIAVVEDALDAEIKKFDDEVDRKVAEEKQRQEEAYINRQAILTKMGATYQNGSFVLGEASFESELVKGASQDIWEEAIVPKFKVEYERIESIRVQQEKEKSEREAEMKAEQEKLRVAQEAFKIQQEEFNRQQAETARIEREKALAAQHEKERIEREAEFEKMKVQAAEAAEAKRLADIEAAIKKEQERKEEEIRQAEIKRVQEEERKKAELDAAGDKVKYTDLIQKIQGIELPEMRSGQYRRKVAAICSRIEEILGL
jgi:hypothetical protein